jgi:Large extracellular alpha-helical protein
MNNFRIKLISLLAYSGVVSAILFCAVACKHRVPSESSPEEIAQYVEACSAGEIKVTSTIQVLFNETVASQDSSAAVSASRIMSFTPSLKGNGTWDRTARKLEFTPDKGQLKAGQTYYCRVRQGKIIPGAKDIVFSFKVAERAAEMEVTEVRISSADPETAIVRGTVTLSEPVDDGLVTSDLFKTSTTWTTPATVTRIAEDSFEYEISGLRRSLAGSAAVKLYFAADAIGFGKRVGTAATIPGMAEFKVIQASLVDAAEPYISVQFSEPLSENQSLEGLVYLDEMEAVRIEREGAGAKLFFADSNVPSLTLRVDRRIRSDEGKQLGAEFKKIFRSAGIPPAVELLIEDGILPDENNLKLPFKAVNLCAVDVEVIKIFRSNVLSFYQDNSLRGTTELRRYGRLIYKTTARLDTDPAKNLHQWQNFSIDLKNLFRQEKGAIYRIKLTFKQEYSLYDRNEAPAVLEKARMTPKDEEPWDTGNSWYSTWYDYHTDAWEWSEREDPLKPSYYMVNDRFPELNLVASNIGIIVKSADESKLWVTTADLVSSRPLPGVKLTAYNYQLQPVGEAYSNESGFADLALRGKPYIIQAEKGYAVSHLKMHAHEKSLSRFDTGGKKITKGLKGYVYGERGVWRPGDTLHLTLVVEDKLHTLPESHPATMELYTPFDHLYASKTLRSGKDGFYAFEVATEPDVQTGVWNAVFSVGGAQFKHKVHIETIKPNRLKINLKTGSDMLASGEDARISVESHWLTGPVAAHLDGTLEVVLNKTTLPFPEYRGYTFTDPLKAYTSENLAQISFRLDSSGRASVTKEMPEAKDAPGMLKADLICKVSEPGGNTSTVANTVRFSPFSHYVGIDLKDTDYETDKDLVFKVVSLDAHGKAVAGRDLEYKIYRLGWNWWWECDAQDLDRYVSGKSAELESSGKLTSTGTYTLVPFSVKYPDYGKFLILVKDVESGHTTGGTFFVDWPLWRGHSSKSDPEALSMLSFTTDKRSYEVGEMATVYLPVSAGGHALVSFENSAGVLSRTWVATSGTGETAWKFRITDKMAPNFYLHITLLQPHRQTVNDLPIRMYGVQNITVSNPASHLTPVIDCPDVVRPQTPFRVRVKEEKGKAMTYTLAIVDEGLLDLTDFRTPNPWPTMNEREALGVRTWDMYDDVIGAYAGKFTQVLSLGGDMALRGTKKENRFLPVVKFLGPFTLNGGVATHKIDLPMYVGSVRVMVVAGHAGAYGNAEKSVIVRSPLMLLSTLPRRLSPDESVKLPVNVFAMEQGVKDVRVKVDVTGPVQIDGDALKNLHFSSPGDSLVVFSLKTDASKSGPVSVTVTAEGGGFKAHETINIEVVNPNPLKTETFTKMISLGEQADFSWKGRTPEERESAMLEIASFPAIDFTGAFEFVHAYKHLCTEQLSSNAFFLLYARKFLGENDKAEAERLLPGILSHLASRQLPDGGFAYWPGSGYSNSWATSMAGQVLLEAKRQGFQVQQRAIEGWIKFQKQSVRNYKHSEYYNLSDLDQAYRLYTLALVKNADLGAMNRLKETSGISLQARWRLAAAYAVAGKTEPARQLTDDSLISIATPSNGLGDTWWSRLRDEAMILDALVETGNLEKAMELAAKIANEFSSRSASTQELAWTSKSMSTLAEGVGTAVTNVSFYQKDGIQSIQGGRSIIGQNLDYSLGEVHVLNGSSSSVYTNLSVRTRADIHETVQPASNGVKVSVKWQTLNGEPLSIAHLEQGTEFRAVITVNELTGTTTSESMALTFTAPSGWEIWNDRLFGNKEDSGEYRDIRDNEVRWYFTLRSSGSREFTVRLQAAYEGKFHLPEILCEDMYNPDYRSNTESWKVCVGQ